MENDCHLYWSSIDINQGKKKVVKVATTIRAKFVIVERNKILWNPYNSDYQLIQIAQYYSI
jgi:hypothetical protein